MVLKSVSNLCGITKYGTCCVNRTKLRDQKCKLFSQHPCLTGATTGKILQDASEETDEVVDSGLSAGEEPQAHAAESKLFVDGTEATVSDQSEEPVTDGSIEATVNDQMAKATAGSENPAAATSEENTEVGVNNQITDAVASEDMQATESCEKKETTVNEVKTEASVSENVEKSSNDEKMVTDNNGSTMAAIDDITHLEEAVSKKTEGPVIGEETETTVRAETIKALGNDEPAVAAEKTELPVEDEVEAVTTFSDTKQQEQGSDTVCTGPGAMETKQPLAEGKDSIESEQVCL